jgi:hypothetical protein
MNENMAVLKQYTCVSNICDPDNERNTKRDESIAIFSFMWSKYHSSC